MLKGTRLFTTSLFLACKESKAFSGFLGPFEGEKGALERGGNSENWGKCFLPNGSYKQLLTKLYTTEAT